MKYTQYIKHASTHAKYVRKDITRTGNKARTDALNLMWARGAARDDRRLGGLHSYYLQFRLHRLQKLHRIGKFMGHHMHAHNQTQDYEMASASHSIAIGCVIGGKI